MMTLKYFRACAKMRLLPWLAGRATPRAPVRMMQNGAHGVTRPTWNLVSFLAPSLIGTAFLIAAVSGTAAETNRVISADLKLVKGPRSMAWQDCVGAGRVAEGLRGGWRQQLEDAHREIGF